MNPKLYIGNLGPNVTEADLRALFSRAGAVAAVELMLDPTSGQSRGYAFVTMATPELAAAALNDFHSYKLGERYITVTEARPPQEPKGPIGQGFDVGPSAPFRPGPARDRTRRRSARSGYRRGRRR